MQPKTIVNIHVKQHHVTKKMKYEKNKFYTTVISNFVL
jgi:hypothetical protein